MCFLVLYVAAKSSSVCVHPVKEKHGAEVFSFGVSAVQTPFVKPG